MSAPRIVSCGTIVTDGRSLLLGHASGSARWDIPKGVAESGEGLDAAARRELDEETGLIVPAVALIPLGRFAYLPAKDLALFRWAVTSMPDPARLVCRSIVPRTGRPEFDRFACVLWPAVWDMVGTSLCRVLMPLAGGISERAAAAASRPG